MKTNIIKIIAGFVILVVISICTYCSYKAKPVIIHTILKNGISAEISVKYDYQNKWSVISVTEAGNIIEEWQEDYFSNLKELKCELHLVADNVLGNQIYNFYSMSSTKNEPINVVFNVDTRSIKEFVEIKSQVITNAQNNTIELILPDFLGTNEKIKLKYKNKYMLKKEEEKKQKEWQEKILSNCVYKTSDGVCFTTTIFKSEPIVIEKDNRSYQNYWLGAKDACESKGYRLPNDTELRSLFGDIMGVIIRSGVGIETQVDPADTPTNYNILKKISPNDLKPCSISLWENENFDNEHAYYRQKSNVEINYSIPDIICVYDSNGKPHKSLLQMQKEQEKNKELEKLNKQRQFESEAKNDLF